jgi:hypothetical protein
MFGLFKKTVSVSFVEHATGKTIGSSEMPLERLPDTFARNTELDIAGTQYVVTGAEPETKAAFAKTKRLTVTLRKVEHVDPKKILFTLPSICNSALPATEPGRDQGRVHVLHEDDWRQCEYVAVADAGEISRELEAVRRIHATASTAHGWREIHVRKRIPSPLAPGMLWNDVVSQLGPVDLEQRVALGDASHAVSGAVAARFDDGVILWGVEAAGELTVLCVEKIESASVPTIEALQRVANAHSLVLVHWCRCQAYAPAGRELENASGNPWEMAR